MAKVPSELTLTAEELRRALPNCKRLRFEAGKTIVREATRASSCFLILHGKVQIVKRGRFKRNIPLATMKAGNFFGEMAFLSGQTRIASAVALTRVEVIEVKRADLDRLIRQQNEFAIHLILRLSKTMAQRCAQMIKLLARQPFPENDDKKQPVDVRQVLHQVYSLWAV